MDLVAVVAVLAVCGILIVRSLKRTFSGGAPSKCSSCDLYGEACGKTDGTLSKEL